MFGVKRAFLGVSAVLSVLGLAFIMLGDSAPAPVSDVWRSLFSDEGPVIRANAGFGEFRAESERIQDRFDCRRFAERPGDEFNDRRRHCIIGESGTVRVSIYEPVGHEGLTKKIKFIWLDNEQPNARGDNAPEHADLEDARQAVRTLSAIYLPKHGDQLLDMFDKGGNGIVTELPFTAVVSEVQRPGFRQVSIEIQDGNHEQLAGSEERQGRPGYNKCLFILGNIPPLKGIEIGGDPVPDRSDLYVTYFLSSDRGEQFLCEIHNSGYYRIRVSRQAGQAFQVLAHGNLGDN